MNVKSINKFWNALLVSNRKTALNFLSISISEKVTWTVRRRQAGWESDEEEEEDD